MNFLKKNHEHLNNQSGVSKTLKQILAIGFMFNFTIICAQEQAYVTADNGLTIREKPDVGSEKIGKLNYGESIEIAENTDLKLVVVDNGKKIAGNWVKVKTRTKYGYVFGGYLSKDKLKESLEVDYLGLNIKIKNIKSTDEFKVKSFFENDTINVNVELGDSPMGKTLIVRNKNYKRVSIFQRFANSITIMNEGSHCDLTEWKHYYSQWKPVKQISTDTYETLSYTEKNWSKFVGVTKDKLKEEILDYCGEDWAKKIENTKSIKDYPIGISTNKIFLKILITDFDDKTTEKIIEFEIPMGC